MAIVYQHRDDGRHGREHRRERIIGSVLYLRSDAILAQDFFFFSSRRRHTRCGRDWSSDVVLFRSRVFALTMAAGRPGKWNIDMGRFARENRPPADYLNKSYYEIWLAGLETLLGERGLVSADEIVAGHPLGEPKRVDGILRHGDVETLLYRGRPTGRPASDPARFRIGDRIRAKNIHPTTHTRLPRYVRGRAGVIESLH